MDNVKQRLTNWIKILWLQHMNCTCLEDTNPHRISGADPGGGVEGVAPFLGSFRTRLTPCFYCFFITKIIACCFVLTTLPLKKSGICPQILISEASAIHLIPKWRRIQSLFFCLHVIWPLFPRFKPNIPLNSAAGIEATRAN